MTCNMKAGLCFDDNVLSGTMRICILLQSEHLINACTVTSSVILKTLISDECVFISITHLDRPQQDRTKQVKSASILIWVARKAVLTT